MSFDFLQVLEGSDLVYFITFQIHPNLKFTVERFQLNVRFIMNFTIKCPAIQTAKQEIYCPVFS